jgi:hypothetical protein
LGPPVSSTNKTDGHDITEILLKVALNTMKQTNINFIFQEHYQYKKVWEKASTKNITSEQ